MTEKERTPNHPLNPEDVAVLHALAAAVTAQTEVVALGYLADRHIQDTGPTVHSQVVKVIDALTDSVRSSIRALRSEAKRRRLL